MPSNLHPSNSTKNAVSRLGDTRYLGASSLLPTVALAFVMLAGCSRSANETTENTSAENTRPVEPAPVETGVVRIDPECDPLVLKSVEKGLVTVEDAETQRSFPLSLNQTELPAGRYRLRTIWEKDAAGQAHSGAGFRFRDPDFTVLPGHTVTLAAPIELSVSWKLPSIPDSPGASATWQGRVVDSSTPKPRELAYRLTASTGASELVEDRRCRWLDLELTAVYPGSGPLTETGHLLIDQEVWSNQQRMKILRGWLTISNRDIRDELAVLHDKRRAKTDASPPEKIVVPVDPFRDAVSVRAEELQVPLPEGVLRLTDVINLVFGAELEGCSDRFLSMRRLLAGPRVIYDRTDRPIDTGNLICLNVRSAPMGAEDSEKPRFELARNDSEVPFGLVSVNIRNNKFAATLDLTRFTQPDKAALNVQRNEQHFESQVQDLAELPPPADFDLAVLPTRDGVSVEYLGEIAHGSSRKTSFRAAITTLGTQPSEQGIDRWLKIEIRSGQSGLGLRHLESAFVRVDQTDYELTGRMQIREGWFLFEDRNSDGRDICLPFDELGDLTQLRDDLEILTREQQSAVDRLTVHDVLALLFNADLPESTSSFILLRQQVSGLLSGSTGRTMRREDNLKLRNEKRVAGKVWEFDGRDVSYTFRRSHQVPFSFCSIRLECGPVKLAADLDSPADLFTREAENDNIEGTAIDTEQLRRLADSTQTRLSECHDEFPNIRVWHLSSADSREAPERLMAEFTGEIKPARGSDVRSLCLRLVDGEERLISNDAELSPEDREWIRSGRFWQLLTESEPVRGRFEPGSARKYGDPEQIDITLTESGETVSADWDDLSPTDQEWVRQAIRCWHR